LKVLLDTHALLWFLLDDPALSGTARELIRNPQTEVFVSPASYWEIAIKISIGKYRLPEPLAAFMDRELAAIASTSCPSRSATPIASHACPSITAIRSIA
jgi:Uncharacterized protein conserved in bacteria